MGIIPLYILGFLIFDVFGFLTYCKVKNNSYIRKILGKYIIIKKKEKMDKQ